VADEAPKVVKAVREALLSDSAVTASLATYDFGGDAEEPAVFGFQPIPADAQLPAIAIDLAGGSSWGTRSYRGAELIVDVQVWGEKHSSRAALRDTAWAVWRCLDRTPLVLQGYEDVGVQASPPRPSPDPDGFPGYLVEVRARILEE